MILLMKIEKLGKKLIKINFEKALKDIEKQEKYKDDDSMIINNSKYNI